MRRTIRRSHLSGSALIEVLIAAFIIGFIILSLVHFQGTIIQNTGYAKSRSLAMSLAQAKLDDLRSFSQIGSGAAGIFGYAEIGTNSGGHETGAGSLSVASGGHTIANVGYTLNWTCAEQFYDSTGALQAESPCSTITSSGFKRVAVTVNWLEPITGATETVALASVIHPDDPLLNARGLLKEPKARPIVRFSPGALPEYVPVKVQLDTNQESSSPEPDATRHAHNVATKFDAIQYQSTGLETLSRREFLTVNCTCLQNGTGQGRSPARPTLPQLAERVTIVAGEGQIVSKRIGVTLRTGQLNSQPAACDVCCRDHHDSSTVDLKYDPFDGGPAGPGGDHDHYNRNNNGNLVLANNVGQTYIEACRFQRINGLEQLVQDWRLANLTVVPETYLNNFAMDYVNFVDLYTRNYITAISLANYPGILPNPAPLLANLPTEVLLGSAGSTRKLQARALYVDYMTPTEISSLKQRLLENPLAFILPYVPFYEVNVTRLANWSVGAPTLLSVTNAPIEDGKEDTYSRGEIKALLPGTTFALATIEKSNSGLTDSHVINPADAATASKSMPVIVTGLPVIPPLLAVTGNILISGDITDVTPSDVIVVGTNGAMCTKPTQGSFRCSLNYSGSGTVTFSNFQGVNPDTSKRNKICPSSQLVYTLSLISRTQDVYIRSYSTSCT